MSEGLPHGRCHTVAATWSLPSDRCHMVAATWSLPHGRYQMVAAAWWLLSHRQQGALQLGTRWLEKVHCACDGMAVGKCLDCALASPPPERMLRSPPVFSPCSVASLLVPSLFDPLSDGPHDTCRERRVFYRLLSGLHTSITVHVASSFLNDDSSPVSGCRGGFG